MQLQKKENPVPRSIKASKRLGAALMLGMLAFVSACGWSADGGESASGLKKIRIITSSSGPSTVEAPFHIATEKGWFEEEGIEIEILYSPGSGAAIQQLAAGNGDVASTTPASVMQANQQGTEISMVMHHTYNQWADMAAPEGSGITSIADLEGKTLGVSELSGGEMPLVRAALSSAGLVEGEDVQIVPAGEGDPSTVGALENGTIDAFASSKRDIMLLEINGFETPMASITPPEIMALPGDGLAMTSELLEDDPAVAEGFIRAAVKGFTYVMAEPDVSYAWVQENLPEALSTDPDLARAFFDLSVDGWSPELPPAVPQRGLFDVGSWEDLMGYLQEGEDEARVLDGPVDLDRILDDSMVEAAYEAIDVAAIEAEAKSDG